MDASVSTASSQTLAWDEAQAPGAAGRRHPHSSDVKRQSPRGRAVRSQIVQRRHRAGGGADDGSPHRHHPLPRRSRSTGRTADTAQAEVATPRSICTHPGLFAMKANDASRAQPAGGRRTLSAVPGDPATWRRPPLARTADIGGSSDGQRARQIPDPDQPVAVGRRDGLQPRGRAVVSARGARCLLVGTREHPLRINGVFEGGGVEGIAYCGALQALAREGFWFRGVAGSSAGALTATVIGCGLRPNEILNESRTLLDAFRKPGKLAMARRLRSTQWGRTCLYDVADLRDRLDELLRRSQARFNRRTVADDEDVTFRTSL